MSFKKVIPLAGVVAWSVATLLIPNTGLATDLTQPKPEVLPQEANIVQVGQPMPAPAALTLGITRAETAPVPDQVTKPVEVATGPAEQSLEKKQGLARELRQADHAMQPGGFGEACFEQMRAFFCPIFGQIPIAREMVGQMALIGGFSCPTSTPAERG